MEQLLQITTIPISYELKVNHASLERHNGSAEVEISRNKGGMQIKSRPIQIKLDTYEARNSVVPTTKTSIYQAAQKGQNAAYQASAQYASEGKLMLQTKIGEGAETIDQILANRTAPPTGDFELGFTPKAGPEIDWEPASLSIEYEMDKLNFDLRVDQGRVEFIPGSIEMTINQYPEVNIEYVGDPIYVPPSAVARFTGEHIDVEA
ncbi:MAG: hypothetical protein HFE76_00255 [Firmicutes bacterium]|nr:hypothetical protein [Bacillota bacterium]